MLDKLSTIEKKYEELTAMLSDPRVISVQSEFQKYSKEHSDLHPIVEKIREYKKLLSELESTEELLRGGDGDIRELAQAELEDLKKRKPLIEDELKFMLLPVETQGTQRALFWK